MVLPHPSAMASCLNKQQGIYQPSQALAQAHNGAPKAWTELASRLSCISAPLQPPHVSPSVSQVGQRDLVSKSGSQQEACMWMTHSSLPSVAEQEVHWAGSDPHRRKKWRCIWVDTHPPNSCLLWRGDPDHRVKTSCLGFLLSCLQGFWRWGKCPCLREDLPWGPS